jgi:predicted signal transduction protein with EAL and GGDEF domain
MSSPCRSTCARTSSCRPAGRTPWRPCSTARRPDPGLLTLEVTESVFVREGERAQFVLNDLKDICVKLALDDFGTGYSSFGYLRRFPVDSIKVDENSAPTSAMTPPATQS